MKVIFFFENTLCLEKKQQQKLCAHNVSPLHLLCLGVTCSPGEPPCHTAAAPDFVFLTALSSSLWGQASYRSMSFDLTPLSIVKTALSKQPCHWNWEWGVLHSDKAPLTLESLHLIHSFIPPVFLLLCFCQSDEWWLYRVTFHRCTEGPLVLMSHSTNISSFSLNFITAMPNHLMRPRHDREVWD